VGKGIVRRHNSKNFVKYDYIYTGLSLALRRGKEHWLLCLKYCQIELIEGEKPYLKHGKHVKKPLSGLKGRKLKPKIVLHHSNSDSKRCLNQKNYSFYLNPLSKPTITQWYSANFWGHNILNTTIARLCKSAGISGFKTNYSLHATIAKRLLIWI